MIKESTDRFISLVHLIEQKEHRVSLFSCCSMELINNSHLKTERSHRFSPDRFSTKQDKYIWVLKKGTTVSRLSNALEEVSKPFTVLC